MSERPLDCCLQPHECDREDCMERREYREWLAWWDSLTPEQKGEDLYWQAVYAEESARGL